MCIFQHEMANKCPFRYLKVLFGGSPFLSVVGPPQIPQFYIIRRNEKELGEALKVKLGLSFDS